jgi:hypothetical protein
MAVSIGGLPKEELFERVKSVRLVSPYAKRLMKHERFTTLSAKSTILQIVLTPEDLGFSDRPTIAEMLDNERLARWSLANLKGWRVELNPPEVGPILRSNTRGSHRMNSFGLPWSGSRGRARGRTSSILNGTTKTCARLMRIGRIHTRFGGWTILCLSV